MHCLDLGAEVFGHGWTIGLVLGVEPVTEGAPRRVEDHGKTGYIVLFAQSPQHVDDAVDRTGRLAAGVGQGRHSVKRPVQIRRAVDEDQFIGHYMKSRSGYGPYGARRFS